MTKLIEYFPMFKTRHQVRADIEADKELEKRFLAMNADAQDRFLDICCGNPGIRILYDVYFKEIFDPDGDPERLISLLSLLLNKKIVSVRSLRERSALIIDNQSLMILDIVVELDDGSIVNVEVQKIGYNFPGQRAASYSSDLLLRQYGQGKKDEKDFDYRKMKPVYSIIFIEDSPSNFHKYPRKYFHVFRQVSNTGLEMELLQYYIFIPLDIFRENLDNGIVKREDLSRLDAWLLFLSSDRPEDIIAVTEQYPEFRPIYEHLFSICQNEERMMDMFEEELRTMDHNTVKLMIDELKENYHYLEEKYQDLEEKSRGLEEKSQGLEETVQGLQKDKQSLEEENQELKNRIVFLMRKLENNEQKDI